MEEGCSGDLLVDPHRVPISLGDREGALRLSIHSTRCPSVRTEVEHRSWEKGETGG